MAVRTVRLTEKFDTFFSPEKLSGSFGFDFSCHYITREQAYSENEIGLMPAKRPSDCRLKCLENNKIVFCTISTVLSAQIVDILVVIVIAFVTLL
jgi:hypothetical protein